MSSALPAHWPKHYNGSNEPCDILDGPCACGAWHTRGDWIAYGYPAEFGWTVGTWEWYTEVLDLWLFTNPLLGEPYDLGTVHPEA